jgi:anti-anti-sigma regulatory factor
MDKESTLPPDLSIAHVGELQSNLLTILQQTESAPPPAFDASAVDHADSAGVQLLVAFDKSLKARERRLVLHQPSQTLISVCASLGLSDWLASTQAAEATA